MKFKDNQVQPELFSDISSLTKKKKRARLLSPSFQIALSHDNAIFLGIFLVMLMVFAFSFGVEWGRRSFREIMSPEKKQIVGLDKKREVSNLVLKTKKLDSEDKNAPKVKREELLEAIKTDKDKRRYTIQVATYRKETFAQREASNLKELGLQIHIVRRSGLIEVCVGDYSNREEAKRLLKELKKRYGDCFIKNL